ncbi:MAG: DNA mismatch endonuclease Vsr [Planctomycetales bacterium]
MYKPLPPRTGGDTGARSRARLKEARIDHQLVTTPQRSALMGRVRARDTQPELRVRRLLHGLGFRYRLHAADLPGRPDLVLPRYETVIFVHGCYWHRHRGCKRTTTPKANREFWQAKFAANKNRDRRNVQRLVRAGWNAIVVWECETRDPEMLADRLQSLLGEICVGSGSS